MYTRNILTLRFVANPAITSKQAVLLIRSKSNL